MSTWIVMLAAPRGGPSLDLLRLLDGLFDAADHHERLLGQVVVLAAHDRLEAPDRVLERHVFAFLARERLRDRERLRQEVADLARALHDELVVLRELVHA